MFTCRCCKQYLEDHEARSGSLTKKTESGICKKCHSIQSYEIQVTRQIKNRPNDYMFCDECDRSFVRWGKKAPSFYQKREDRKECPFCSSKNIDYYQETA